MADEQIIIDIQVDSEEIKTANARVDELSVSILELEVATKKAREENKKNIQVQKELDKQRIKGDISEKQHKEATKKLNEVIKQNNVLIAKNTVEISKQKRERAANIKLIKNEGNEYIALSNKLNLARKKAKDLAVQMGLNSKEFKKAANEVKKLDAQLKKIDDKLGQNQRSVGKYTDAFKGLQGAMVKVSAAFFGAQALIAGFRQFISISMDFNKQMSKVQAITNATNKEIRQLKDSAKELGATTAFTAIEVGELQESLARLGFSTDEIIDSTEAVLNLASATGTELAEAATLTASTLNAFNLEASEAARVADVLAKSTTKTGLDMSKLATALPFASTSARLAGKDIEWLAARMGVLVDKGTDASTVGTSIRTIFAELSKQGLTLGEALDKINNSTDKTKTSFDLFGKTAMNAGVILAENTDKAEMLENEFRNAEGAAKDLADTMLDNLAGDLTIAQSAWEGLILSIDEGDGVISRATRGITQAFTDMFSTLTLLNEGKTSLAEIFLEGSASESSEEALARINKRLEDQKKLQDERIAQLPELISQKQSFINALEREGVSVKRIAKAKAELIVLERELGDVAEVKKELTEVEIKQNEIVERQAEKAANEKEKRREDEIKSLEKFEDEKQNIRDKYGITTQQEYYERELELLNEHRDKKILSEIEYQEQLKELKEKFYPDNLELLEDNLDAEVNAIIESDNLRLEKQVEFGAKQVEERGKVNDLTREQIETQLSLISGFTDELGSLIENTIADQNITLKEAGKQFFMFALDQLDKYLQLKIAQITIGSLASADSIATFGAAGVAKAAILSGLAKAAVAGIKGVVSREFGEGTNDIVSIGGSHSSGNDVDVWGYSGGSSQYFGKVERGEAMPVIRKSAVNDYMVAKLNGKMQSNTQKYATGTNDITQQPVNAEMSMQQMVSAIENANIFVKVEDITKQVAKKVQVVDNSKV